MGAPTPFRMLENPRVSEPEGQFDLQIASETACWPPWRQVGAPRRSAGWPRRPPECLKTLGFLSLRASLTCKLRVKMHVGRLGVKWAARLIEPRGKPMQGPKEALENIFRPLQKSVAKNRVRRAFWQFTFVKRDSFVKLDVSMAASGQGEQNWQTSRTESTFLLCSES